ncbi:hypothetical protein CKO51_28015 [Rhodopirellula sp. SM50]|nr:hypothetical protein CKO51_28015 [Rhodopirellula sp. SM50]
MAQAYGPNPEDTTLHFAGLVKTRCLGAGANRLISNDDQPFGASLRAQSRGHDASLRGIGQNQVPGRWREPADLER